eukprot:1207260-Lingulodinium_polyedra.AAC.1
MPRPCPSAHLFRHPSVHVDRHTSAKWALHRFSFMLMMRVYLSHALASRAAGGLVTPSSSCPAERR